MDVLAGLTIEGVINQFLLGLSRAMILFIVSAGLSMILGSLRVPNIAHGSFYMIGAYLVFIVVKSVGIGPNGFWLGLILAPIGVALVGFLIDRGLFRYIYEREHILLLLFTFSVALILADLVKIFCGAEFRTVMRPTMLVGSLTVFGISMLRYDIFLLIIGPVIAICLWGLINKTKIGKISVAAAVDREMVGAVGINVNRVFAFSFATGAFLAGLGGALIAPKVPLTLGMDFTIVIECFLIVIIGGLGNVWGALLGALIFGLTQSLGILVWPQFAIVFPYTAVVIVLLLRPRGLLKSIW